MSQEITFSSLQSRVVLRGRLILPSAFKPPFPTVIMLTGDGPKGTKSLTWSNIPPLLSSHGIASFLFDFEGLGFSDGDRRILTVTRGIDNFTSAMAFLRSQPVVDSTRLGALASSFGAVVLISSPEQANTLRAIGLKSPASFLPDAYLSEVGFELYDRWLDQGYLQENGYFFDVLQDALRYDVYASARNISAPCLITHGTADKIVPVIHSKYLMRSLAGTNALHLFNDVGHGYSEGDSWVRMATLFANWFAERLLS